MDIGRGVVTGCYHQLVDGLVLSMERNIASQVSADFVYQLLLIGTHPAVSTAFCEGRGVFSKSWYNLLPSDALASLVTLVTLFVL